MDTGTAPPRQPSDGLKGQGIVGGPPHTGVQKRKWIIAVALTLVVIVIVATITVFSVPRAQKNPLDFTLSDTNETPWNLEDHTHQGKPILIEFIHPDCAVCGAVTPVLVQLHSVYGERVEFVTILITFDVPGFRNPPTYSMANEFKTAYDTPWTYLVETNGTHVRDLYAVNLLPTIVIIGKDGNVAWRHTGTVDYPTIENAVKAVI